MKINKLLGAFSNIDKITEGLKNKIFKKEHVEEIAKVRWEECYKCEHLDEVGTNCALSTTKPCCGKCGCSIGLKIRALASSCPVGKWKPVVAKKEQGKIMRQIKENEDASNI